MTREELWEKLDYLYQTAWNEGYAYENTKDEPEVPDGDAERVQLIEELVELVCGKTV